MESRCRDAGSQHCLLALHRQPQGSSMGAFPRSQATLSIRSRSAASMLWPPAFPWQLQGLLTLDQEASSRSLECARVRPLWMLWCQNASGPRPFAEVSFWSASTTPSFPHHDGCPLRGVPVPGDTLGSVPTRAVAWLKLKLKPMVTLKATRIVHFPRKLPYRERNNLGRDEASSGCTY